MGIQNLMYLIKKYCSGSIKYKKIDAYKNCVVGIDTNLLIYKMIYAIRLNGYDIKNGNVIVTHIHTFLQKVRGFLKYKIKPVFVFDGEMPHFKSKTITKRKLIGKQLQKKYYSAVTDVDKKKYYYMKSKITDREIDDIVTMIKVFGFPIIFAPYEADCQLAYLQKEGLIDYVVSDDMDLLVFGSGILLKDFTVSDKKYICEINLGKILKGLGVSYKQFVEIAILMGTDYNDRVYGPVKSYDEIKKCGSIKCVVKGEYGEVEQYFINPPIRRIKEIKFGSSKRGIRGKLIEFLGRFNYSDNKIGDILEKLKI